MESRFLLDVVVGKSSTVLELLSSKDETLLIGRDTFLVLNLGLDVVDRIRGFDFESDLERGRRRMSFRLKREKRERAV